MVVVVALVAVAAGSVPAGARSKKGREADRSPQHHQRRSPSGKPHSGPPHGKGPAADDPASFVAELDGRVVVGSAATGNVVRTLTGEQPGGGAGDPAVDADRQVVWFSRGDGSCATHLASVPVAGGPETPMPGSGEYGTDSEPLPRPGYDQIAFYRAPCHPDPAGDPAATPGGDPGGGGLVVSDAQGLEGHGQTGFIPVAWSGDGKRLLATPANRAGMAVLDVDDNGAVTNAADLTLADQNPDCSLSVVGFRPDAEPGYVAVRRCAAPGEDIRRALVVLDEAGAVRSRSLHLSSGQDFVEVAFDRQGDSLLYSTVAVPVGADDPAAGDSEPEVTLWRRQSGTSRAVARQSRYRHVSWAP